MDCAVLEGIKYFFQAVIAIVALGFSYFVITRNDKK